MKNEMNLFESQRIRHLYDEDKEVYFFSIVDVVSILIEKDYQNAKKYWKVLKGRIIKEGFIELVTNCYQLKMQADDGKMRKTDVGDIKTIFRVIQSVPSKKADNYLPSKKAKQIKNKK